VPALGFTKGKTNGDSSVIHNGRVEVRDPIPAEWEGQTVQITTMTPDDPLLDLDERLAALHALGPIEYEPGEREGRFDPC
jgi:hypothetical protein